MNVNMTIGGVECKSQVLVNELTCRIPKGLVIPVTGLPVKVSHHIRSGDDVLVQMA